MPLTFDFPTYTPFSSSTSPYYEHDDAEPLLPEPVTAKRWRPSFIARARSARKKIAQYIRQVVEDGRTYFKTFYSRGDVESYV